MQRLETRTVTDVVGLVIHEATPEQLAQIRAYLDIGGSTLYQYGERKPNGKPYRNMPAAMVPKFCDAVRAHMPEAKRLHHMLIDCLAQQCGLLTVPMPGSRTAKRYSQGETASQAAKTMYETTKSFEDRKVTPAEKATLLQCIGDFLDMVQNIETDERLPNVTSIQDAQTIEDRRRSNG